MKPLLHVLGTVTLLVCLALFMSFIIAGCINTPETTKTANTKDSYWIDGGRLRIIVLDSCEYILSVSNDASANLIIHKGNCNNPIHHEKR